jgi:glucokinase
MCPLLKYNPMDRKLLLAIDLGGTNLKIALLNLKYKIITKANISTKRFKRNKDLISGIASSLEKIIQIKNLNAKDILGVGLGLPGPIDAEKGIVHFFPNIPGWREVNLKQILKKKIRLPIFLDNDANLMCLAEHRLGAAKGLENVLCLTLGTGVGGGLIIHNKLYRGSDFAAGEIGHMPINEFGRHCNCGGQACLETYIGNRAILKDARRTFKRDISLEELSALAKRGNIEAKKIWRKVGQRLGIALTGVVNLLNLDAVIIGGGVAGAGRVLFDAVKDTLKHRAMRVQAKSVKILKAKLGSDAGLIGGALLVKEGVSS